MDREPQASSSNMTNNGISDMSLRPFIGLVITNNNYYGITQNNAQIVNQVNNYSAILNENISFGVELNNNTVHQQFNQPVQSTSQSLHRNQVFQSPMNYIYQDPSNYLQHNMSTPITSPMVSARKRPIIIDGLNIGYAHGLHRTFSAKGMFLCLQFFIQRGFQSVKIMLPQHHRGKPGTETHAIISMLLDLGYIYFTPSRKIQSFRLTCYSDRIILDYAMTCGGVVVSNDNFRDLYNEDANYKYIILNRHIMIMFIDDEIIMPNDQYSKDLPWLTADNILHFPD